MGLNARPAAASVCRRQLGAMAGAKLSATDMRAPARIAGNSAPLTEKFRHSCRFPTMALSRNPVSRGRRLRPCAREPHPCKHHTPDTPCPCSPRPAGTPKLGREGGTEDFQARRLGQRQIHGRSGGADLLIPWSRITSPGHTSKCLGRPVQRERMDEQRGLAHSQRYRQYDDPEGMSLSRRASQTRVPGWKEDGFRCHARQGPHCCLQLKGRLAHTLAAHGAMLKKPAPSACLIRGQNRNRRAHVGSGGCES